MNPSILEFLADMATAILTIAGVAYLPLIVLIVFRAGGLRGLNEENANERLLDLCCDTLKEQIKNKIEELLQGYYSVPLPSGRRIQDAAAFLHQDSESLEQLLLILKNLTELGVQSQEFIKILLYLSQ